MRCMQAAGVTCGGQIASTATHLPKGHTADLYVHTTANSHMQRRENLVEGEGTGTRPLEDEKGRFGSWRGKVSARVRSRPKLLKCRLHLSREQSTAVGRKEECRSCEEDCV